MTRRKIVVIQATNQRQLGQQALKRLFCLGFATTHEAEALLPLFSFVSAEQWIGVTTEGSFSIETFCLFKIKGARPFSLRNLSHLCAVGGKGVAGGCVLFHAASEVDGCGGVVK